MHLPAIALAHRTPPTLLNHGKVTLYLTESVYVAPQQRLVPSAAASWTTVDWLRKFRYRGGPTPGAAGTRRRSRRSRWRRLHSEWRGYPYRIPKSIHLKVSFLKARTCREFNNKRKPTESTLCERNAFARTPPMSGHAAILRCK
jgi:hypothetical protein